MSFFPILNAPNVKGWTTLSNFSPNKWEVNCKNKKFVNVTWASAGEWLSYNLGSVEPGEFYTVSEEDVADIIKSESVALLSLTIELLPAKSNILPNLNFNKTFVPSWRATMGLSSATAKTSYQGEMNPFPLKSSLLTFAPFMQTCAGTENYILLLNAEKSPIKRFAELEIYDAEKLTQKGKFTLENNKVNCIRLDELGFEMEDLPLIICKDMAAIPHYFSNSLNGKFLSLEHTHPPASFVVHGKRWLAQKLVKEHWFSKVI